MKTRIIGLGNTILTDDGAGVYVAREVARRLAETGRSEAADVVESEVAGFALLELMSGWERVILVDSISLPGLAPGALIELQPEALRTSLRLQSAHEIDLRTALRLGRSMGLAMPEEVRVLAIQAADSTTFGECVTGAVARGVRSAVDWLLQRVDAGPLELAPAPEMHYNQPS